MHADLVVDGFDQAADAFRSLLEQPRVAERWDEPAVLEGYAVGGLVAHVVAAVAWTIPLLDTTGSPDVGTLALGHYYASLRIEPDAGERGPVHDALLALGARSAEKGVEHQRHAFESCVATLRERLAGDDLDRAVHLGPTIPWNIRLADLLATRVVELVVHADDLAVSLDVEPPAPGPAAGDVTVTTLTATARAVHGDAAVLRALTRRERTTTEVFPVL